MDPIKQALVDVVEEMPWWVRNAYSHPANHAVWQRFCQPWDRAIIGMYD